MQVSAKMAQVEGTVRRPAENDAHAAKPAHHGKDETREVKSMAEKEAPKAHEAPREHNVVHDKDAPKEHGAAHDKEAPREHEHKAVHDKEASKEPARAAKAAPAPVKKKAPVAKIAKPKVVGKSDIGIDVKPPAKACTDRNCPFHGRLPVRGQIFDGIVVSDGMDKSAVIRRERTVYVPKYERYLKRTSRMSVHSPPCIEAKEGDEVTVMECRPLSKTIAFTIVSKKADQKARAE
jgi:small subunit ribosomal protein S17